MVAGYIKYRNSILLIDDKNNAHYRNNEIIDWEKNNIKYINENTL